MLYSQWTAEPAERSFMDLILVYGDHKKFKIFHSQEASCWISSHFCKVVSKPAAHLEKHGDAFFCHVEVYRSIFKSSIHPFSLRDSTISTEAWFYKERRDNVNSEYHFSRTKTSLKRNISGSSSSGRNMCTLVIQTILFGFPLRIKYHLVGSSISWEKIGHWSHSYGKYCRDFLFYTMVL